MKSLNQFKQHHKTLAGTNTLPTDETETWAPQGDPFHLSC